MKSWIVTILLASSVFFGVSWYKERALLKSASTAPAFIAMTAEGDLFRSTELQGRQTLLYFFAPWCGICRLSMPN
ncbi:MAG: heme-binding protein, partial [Alishewanella sp. 32-51-5]